MELFYDAEVSRSVVTATGTLAVRDVPGKALSIRVEGPLGTTLASADWSGDETRIFVAGRRGGERSIPAGSDLSRELGVPVTPIQLSWLLYGLPDPDAPEATRVGGEHAWFSWNNDALRCDFDPSTRRVGMVVSRGNGASVEVHFLGWEAGLPSRIRITTSRGGGAELTLRSAEAGTGG
jgi:hypothetical protein